MAAIPNARQYRHHQRKVHTSVGKATFPPGQPSGRRKESAQFAIVGTFGAIVLTLLGMHWLAMLSAAIAGGGIGQLFAHIAIAKQG